MRAIRATADDEDGNYVWVISAKIIDKVKTGSLKDDDIQEAIQCMMI